MNGKTRCRILKEIRQKIADENDIPYVTAECTHKGECRGTCPRCEAELRYLEQELEKRRSIGKRVAVAAVAAGMAVAATGCTEVDTILQKLLTKRDPIDVTVGEIEEMGLVEQRIIEEQNLAGAAQPAETPEPEIYELDGDVADIREEQ